MFMIFSRERELRNMYIYMYCVIEVYCTAKRDEKRDTVILIDRAEFATRRGSIVSGKILKVYLAMYLDYRTRSIDSIFCVEYANGY